MATSYKTINGVIVCSPDAQIIDGKITGVNGWFTIKRKGWKEFIMYHNKFVPLFIQKKVWRSCLTHYVGEVD